MKPPTAQGSVDLATLLVRRGAFDSRDEARRWVMAGKVLVDGRRVDKPGMRVPDAAHIDVRGKRRYASRGGYKLAAALDHFAITVEHRVALDCGASRGGFTDCLVQRKAALVYAVEAGHGQLAGNLARDARVQNLERTNLGDPLLRSLVPPPSCITLDLSYLSLTKALPLAASLLAPHGDVIALFKPLFEIDDPESRRTGRIEDQQRVVDALLGVLNAGAEAGLAARGVVKLALQPRHGTQEYVLHVSNTPAELPRSWTMSGLAALVEGPGIGPEEVDDSRG